MTRQPPVNSVMYLKCSCLLIVLLLLSGCQAQEIDASGLAELNGVFHDRSTGRPFTGRVTGSLQGNLNQGLWHGRVATYFPGGEIQSEAHFRAGIMHGLTRSWYRSGQLRSESMFVDGELDGPMKQWFDNGQLRSERGYSKGREQGAEREFSREGRLSFERSWAAGRRHGLEIHYCPRNTGEQAPGADSGMCSDSISRVPAPVVQADNERGLMRIWCHDHGQSLDTNECVSLASGL